MSPTAAAITKIRPGMKLTEVLYTNCANANNSHLLNFSQHWHNEHVQSFSDVSLVSQVCVKVKSKNSKNRGAVISKARVLSVQIYTAYMESQEQLQLEKLESKRVNKYLDDIVQEVEAKAPMLKRQREELERAQKSVASLSAKLEHAVQVRKKRVFSALLSRYEKTDCSSNTSATHARRETPLSIMQLL